MEQLFKYPKKAARLSIAICGIILTMPVLVRSQNLVALYPTVVPNSKQGHLPELPSKLNPGLVYRVLKPEIEVYLPERGKATGAAVIICPGGSYKVLSYQGEGIRTAKEFMNRGIAAFVLKYRLPDDSSMVDKTIGPLQDAEQAIKLVRENAKNWGIDTGRVGVMGFSAGGHLAATLATNYKRALIENTNLTNLRPDFLILVYPVISMQDSLTHRDSRTNLLGKNPSKATIDRYSNELQVDSNTPPTYITHAGDDKLVDVDNSIIFYEKLRHHNVAAELHLYPKGGHGFVLGLPADIWMAPIFRWMQNAKWISQ
jgi:acetyl esterase/lipase